jgi:hypothetical protein
MTEVAARWDDEYRKGRYVDERPVPFVGDIATAVRELRPADDVGIYIGCGNGRNYIPLVEAGLDLTGIDVSATAIRQLAERRPDRVSRLVHGDITALPAGSKFGTVIGIQVFQHGCEADAHAHIRAALELLVAGGLFCIRVNASGTQLEHAHTVTETNDAGGFTVVYDEGPKRGLEVHFFGRAELEGLLGDLDVVTPIRRDRTYRPTTGHWDQWEGIWLNTA